MKIKTTQLYNGYTNSLYTISNRYVYAYGSSNVVKETVSVSDGEI